MNAPKTHPRTVPETAADGCCGSGSHHDHKRQSHTGTKAHDHDGCGTSKATDARTQADERKKGHGPGCCCS